MQSFWHVKQMVYKEDTESQIVNNDYIFLVVLYGCETWSLILRDEHRPRVLKSRGLRWIFGTKKDEVKGEWRKLLNEELRDLYSAPSMIIIIKSRRMKRVGHVIRKGTKGNVYIISRTCFVFTLILCLRLSTKENRESTASEEPWSLFFL
jgi:hypothetical protein